MLHLFPSSRPPSGVQGFADAQAETGAKSKRKILQSMVVMRRRLLIYVVAAASSRRISPCGSVWSISVVQWAFGVADRWSRILSIRGFFWATLAINALVCTFGFRAWFRGVVEQVSLAG